MFSLHELNVFLRGGWRRDLRSLLTTYFLAFSRKIHEFQHFVSGLAEVFPPRQILKNNFANCRQKARQSRTSGRRTVRAVCAAYRHSPLSGIDQRHPQRHCQATAGRRTRRASRELPLSINSRQSRLTDMARSTRNRQLFSCRGRLCRATSCL